MIFGYLRCSTMEQGADDRTSLAEQERRIRGVAMMMGQSNLTIIRDVGVSGSVALSDRPAGGQMYGMLQPGDVLVAAKMDRLFRSASDALTTVETLHAKNVKVILVDMGIEPVTDGGPAKMFFTMLAAFAEFERWRTRERTADGRRGKAARGGHIGGDAPYGWTKVGTGRAAELVENDAEQTVIETIVQVHALVGSHNQTAMRIKEMGIKGREGAFNREQIRRIVRRFTATGAAYPCAAAGAAPETRSQ